MSKDDEKAKKLAAVRAERAAIEERRAARAEKDDLATEQAELDLAKALDEAEANYGALGEGIAYVRTAGGPIIIQKPAGAAYRKFVDTSEKVKATDGAMALIMSCVVFPKDKAEARALLDEYTGALAPLTRLAVKLAGDRDPEGKG